ncbi:hypothetical protein ABZP36_021274 [Zizania latifolia]
MAAVVVESRKRGFASFVDDPMRFLDDPHPLPSRQAKRGRCSPSAASLADLGVSMEFDPVDALQLIFPDADPQILQNYFKASGNVLDAAIRGFKDHLASAGSTEPDFANIAASGDRPNDVVSPKDVYDVSGMSIPSNGSEWAELVVRELSNVLDVADAKNRVFRILELFERSTAQCSSPAEMRKMREEHKILKQMLGGLLEQNSILKRAFRIQHNRLNDYDQKMSQERSQLKQIIDKYEEQIKALQNKNYILSFHLAQAKQHDRVSGNGNPDIF